MADDTRNPPVDSTIPPIEDQPQEQQTRPYRRPKPKHDFPQTQAGKLWDAFGDSNVNEMPGGMVNTAGGRPKEVTWKDAFNFSLLTNKTGPAFYQTGCARDSLLVGIGTGGALGGLHFILRGLSKMLITTNIAVVGFTAAAGGTFYWCTSRQREEARGMAAAVAGMKLLHEKKAKERAVEEAAAAARKRKEEEERLKSQRWYKFCEAVRSERKGAEQNGTEPKGIEKDQLSQLELISAQLPKSKD